MRTINQIIVHCSATPPSMDIGVDEIRGWHVDERGWSDVGYHFIIRRNGDLEHGRPIARAGAHAKGFNEKSIGICLIGGTDSDDKTKAEANFTLEQYLALFEHANFLMNGYGIKDIKGHRDLPGVIKACPCFDVKSLFGG